MSATSYSAATLTAALRAVLHENGNKPMRLLHVWERVAARSQGLVRSKTHFKRRIVDQMFARNELIKTHVLEEVKGKGERRLYAMRLKNNAVNRPSPSSSNDAATPSGGAPLA